MSVPQLVSQLRPQAQSSSSGSSTSPIGLFSEGSNSSTEPATSDQGTSQPTRAIESAHTPSLCSDNDPEKDDEHDQPPSTPPLVIPSRNMYRFRGTGIPVTPSDRSQSRILNRSLLLKPQEAEQGQKYQSKQGREQKSETRDNPIDYEDSFVPIHPVTPEDPADHESQPTIFKKRLPVSPLPNRSPRKPHPPNSRRPTPHSKKLSLLPLDHDHEDEDKDDLPVLNFFSPPAAASTPGPHVAQSLNLAKAVVETPDVFTQPSGTPSQHHHHNLPPSPRVSIPSPRPYHGQSHDLKAQPRSRSSHSKRYKSLGEELWMAQQSDGVDGDELDDEDLYVGTGTRNTKEGFLARGGAGGSPVFMGVGYVEGELSRDR